MIQVSIWPVPDIVASQVSSCSTNMGESTHRLGLERVQRLNLSAHVVRFGLEVGDDLLSLRNDRLVLHNELVPVPSKHGPSCPSRHAVQESRPQSRMTAHATAERTCLPIQCTYLEHLLVVRKVDRGRRRLQRSHGTTGLVAALAEGSKLTGSLLAEAGSEHLRKVNGSLRSHGMPNAS